MRITRGLFVGVGIVLGLAGAGAREAEAAPPLGQQRGYAAGHFALEIDGAFAGWVRAVEGGHATSDVVEEQIGQTFYVKKHLANVKFREIRLEVGTNMSPAFYSWIEASFSGNYQRKNGAIVAADYQYRVKQRREFFNALITEVGFPAADAGSKDPAFLTIVLMPEYTRLSSTGVGTTYSAPLCKTTKWLASNFRFKIDGIDASKVRAVGPLAVRVQFVEPPIGEGRDYELEPAKISFPHVLVTVPDVGLQGFQSWFDEFVIAGNNGDDQERGGSLEYLPPNLSAPLFTLTFQNVGIFEIEPGVSAGNLSASIVKLYVELMTFSTAVQGCGGGTQ
jgi:phage tail-like protein